MGIGFVDREKVINKNNRKDYSPYGGHLSINGYKKIKACIVENRKINDFIKK